MLPPDIAGATMTPHVSLLLEFINSLAPLAVLAMGYGMLQRQAPGRRVSPVVLGLLFGLVTVLQMHLPLTPFDGVIIDMRNVPIALAGAFLGVRGLAVCLAVAMLTRYGIGGIGWVSGVAGMALAGAAGLIWHRITARMARRGVASLLALACGMSVHLLAAGLLPADVAAWFLSVAAPVILAVNLVAVPLVGWLLERERHIWNERAAGRPQPIATLKPAC